MTAQISIFGQHTSKTFSFDFKAIFLSSLLFTAFVQSAQRKTRKKKCEMGKHIKSPQSLRARTNFGLTNGKADRVRKTLWCWKTSFYGASRPHVNTSLHTAVEARVIHFIFITQSSRSWNEFLEKRYRSEKSLESPTFSDRSHVASIAVVAGFNRQIISHLVLLSLRIVMGAINFIFAFARRRNELLQRLCAHKLLETLRKKKFCAELRAETK